jgi:hypothetical protein
LHTLWVDLQRGGHILQEEFHQGGNLWHRTHNVTLGSFDSKGSKIWIPVHGEYDLYLNNRKAMDHPVVHETYDVVQGSVVLNQGLDDERFAIDWTDRSVGSTSLDESRAVFRRLQSQAELAAPVHTDTEGIEKDLDRRLAEADSQAARLVVVPSSQQVWNPITIAQITIAVISIGLLTWLVMMRRRS